VSFSHPNELPDTSGSHAQGHFLTGGRPYRPSGRWTRVSQKSSMPLTAARKAPNETGLVT
jgi:hypothetical protein